MTKPEPQIGQIIRYDYLWRDEREQGRVEGSKDRPCAVIVALQRHENGLQNVYVAPITHSPPLDGQPAIEIASQFRALTGLDHERSWLILTELNRVDWSDPGIVPVRPDQWFYGSLPRAIAQRALEQIVELHRKRALLTVDRNPG
ncbi:MAG: hypothetical protein AB7O49_03460 [Sphingomonadales bacterium]